MFSERLLFLLSLSYATRGSRFQEDEDIFREKLDYNTDDDYAYSEDYYEYDYKEHDCDDSHNDVDYKTIH